MSGVTDLPFRRAVARAGTGLVVSEMVASEELARERKDVVRRARGDDAIFPFVIQLAGRQAKWMAEGAKIAEGSGADIIDINMGCPSRQVTGALSGSALMRDLDHALELIEATVAATSRPVTLKMRLGWDWHSLNADELALRAEAAGIQLLVVHGRTRNDFYKGSANWSAVRAVTESVKIPVLVNGDIVDTRTAQEALRQSGADGVMIGRAAVGRPWLPGAIAADLSGVKPQDDVVPEDCEDIVLTHYEDTLTHYGEGLGVRMARKHIAAYVDHFPVEIDEVDRKTFRQALCRSPSSNQVWNGLKAFFSQDFERLDALLS